MRVAETIIHTVTISKWGEVANFQTELWEFVHCKGSQMYSPCHTHFKTGREKSTDELAFCSVTTTSPALPSWMVWIWLEMFLVGLHPIPPSHFLNIYIYIYLVPGPVFSSLHLFICGNLESNIAHPSWTHHSITRFSWISWKPWS